MLGMSEGRGNTESTRRPMMAGLMMALLAGSVGIAWWLAESRRFDPQAAGEILAGIRQRGLPALWGDELVANWYIRYRADGKPVGWSVAKRQKYQGGGYAGSRIEQYGDLFSIQTWALDDTAGTGKCEAVRWRLPGRAGQMPAQLESTKIGFGNGRLDVIQAQGSFAVKALAPLPDDYIPNGLADLAVYEAATRGRKAVFSVLPDGKALARGQANFTRLRVTPEAGRAVRLDLDDPDEELEIMTFDETGRLLMVSYPESQSRLEASTAKGVAKLFPFAARYQQRATTAPATNPDLPSDESEPQELPDAAPGANDQDANDQDGF
jgi:hypothetical protein